MSINFQERVPFEVSEVVTWAQFTLALNMRWALANGHPLNDSHLDYLASKLYGGEICYIFQKHREVKIVSQIRGVLNFQKPANKISLPKRRNCHFSEFRFPKFKSRSRTSLFLHASGRSALQNEIS